MELKSGKMTSKNRYQKLMRENAEKAPPGHRAGPLRCGPGTIQQDILRIGYILGKKLIERKHSEENS